MSSRRAKFKPGMLVWSRYTVAFATTNGQFNYHNQVVLKQGSPVLILEYPKKKDFDADWKSTTWYNRSLIDKSIMSGLICLFEGQKIFLFEKDLLFRQPEQL